MPKGTGLALTQTQILPHTSQSQGKNTGAKTRGVKAQCVTLKQELLLKYNERKFLNTHLRFKSCACMSMCSLAQNYGTDV